MKASSESTNITGEDCETVNGFLAVAKGAQIRGSRSTTHKTLLTLSQVMW
jgi:hypothetical protein